MPSTLEGDEITQHVATKNLTSSARYSGEENAGTRIGQQFAQAIRSVFVNNKAMPRKNNCSI
jgi:hypothetical protein